MKNRSALSSGLESRFSWKKVFGSFASRLARDERGQSTTEYILMLAVVVMIAMKFKQTFLSQMDGIVKGVSANIQNVVEQQQ